MFRPHRYSCSKPTSWLSPCPVIAGDFWRSAIAGYDSSIALLFPQATPHSVKKVTSGQGRVRCRVVPDIRCPDFASQSLKRSFLTSPPISPPPPATFIPFSASAILSLFPTSLKRAKHGRKASPLSSLRCPRNFATIVWWGEARSACLDRGFRY